MAGNAEEGGSRASVERLSRYWWAVFALGGVGNYGHCLLLVPGLDKSPENSWTRL